MKKTRILLKFWGLLAVCLLLTACGAPPRPSNVENICEIFQQYPDWYWYAKNTQTKWGTPIPVQMAIIYQESSFNARARPPRRKLLWVIPWKRPSSAYGYSQALKNTWKEYEKTNGVSATRSAFDDASDFIGWYSAQASHKLGISENNAYALYLAYHEGLGGYARHSYLRKPWLIKVSHKVANRAQIYRSQLARCESSIPRPHWWN